MSKLENSSFLVTSFIDWIINLRIMINKAYIQNLSRFKYKI